MKHLDLFSGIGGFALAARNIWGEKYENVGFVDNDGFCQKVLAKNFPNTKIYGDIKQFSGKGISADLITGGFPCQPFSSAGKRRGTEDDRDLWPEMFRIICEIKPRWIIGENVAGFVNMELERSIADLESQDYEIQPFIIPACAIGAEHRRDRVWIVAHANEDKLREPRISANQENKKGIFKENFKARSGRINELGSIFAMPRNNSYARNRRKFYRIPAGMDRLGALGNAIVPQVAEEIFKAIRYEMET